jgi:hypothetical protein
MNWQVNVSPPSFRDAASEPALFNRHGRVGAAREPKASGRRAETRPSTSLLTAINAWITGTRRANDSRSARLARRPGNDGSMVVEARP